MSTCLHPHTQQYTWYVHTHTYSTVHRALNQRNRWAQSQTSCREMLARVETPLLEETKKCETDIEREEKWGGKIRERATGRNDTPGGRHGERHSGTLSAVAKGSQWQTEAVLSSCRPRSYVRSMWHNQSVCWDKQSATVLLHSLNHEAAAQGLIRSRPSPRVGALKQWPEGEGYKMEKEVLSNCERVYTSKNRTVANGKGLVNFL